MYRTEFQEQLESHPRSFRLSRPHHFHGKRSALACKRAVDVGGSAVFFLLFGWLFLLVWVLVAITQGRPAIFRHKRVGLGGEEFDCLKFRSMVRDSDRVLAEHLEKSAAARDEWERDFKLKDDPRVTSFGRFLRRTSLDELPQFWNVLRGEMSLVGPRPVVRAELDQYYGDAVHDYVRVKPGMTGPWQVSGRHELGYTRRVELDSEYARTWTNSNDMKILVSTLKVVVNQDGSY